MIVDITYGLWCGTTKRGVGGNEYSRLLGQEIIGGCFYYNIGAVGRKHEQRWVRSQETDGVGRDSSGFGEAVSGVK